MYIITHPSDGPKSGEFSRQLATRHERRQLCRPQKWWLLHFTAYEYYLFLPNKAKNNSLNLKNCKVQIWPSILPQNFFFFLNGL